MKPVEALKKADGFRKKNSNTLWRSLQAVLMSVLIYYGDSLMNKSQGDKSWKINADAERREMKNKIDSLTTAVTRMEAKQDAYFNRQ